MSVFLKFTLRSSKLINKNVKFKAKTVSNTKFFFSSGTPLKKTAKDFVSSGENFITFQEMVHQRRAEAERSILVQVNGSRAINELYSYCKTIGTVENMFHYTSGIDTMHYVLVEFREKTGKTKCPSNVNVDLKSQFFDFKPMIENTSDSKCTKLVTENGTVPPSSEVLRETMLNCNDISDQIMVLYDMLKLTDLESRLRFLTARQIEVSISAMMPYAKVMPFGSSVNGFGKMGCDLDVVLTLCNKGDADSKLLAQYKKLSSADKYLEILGDMLRLFMPGCQRVRKILQARVPIIKYHHLFTDVECDLSMSNMSGVHMSDFLYIMGSLDNRVRPLVFAVRKWAYEVGLTNSSPGRWITNFSLTLLVLSFLQHPIHSQPVLPSLNTLVKCAEPKDSLVTDEGVNCTFLRDISKLNHKSENNLNLEDLLCEFFEYYSQFNFEAQSVCLNEVVGLSKPVGHPLYIVNPLEKGLNVSQNVSLDELKKFKTEVKNAAFNLQSADDSSSQNWGLLSLFDEKNKKKFPINFFTAANNSRLMNVRSIFEIDEENVDASKIQYKNSQVKKQVESIKKDTQDKIRNLKNSKNSVT